MKHSEEHLEKARSLLKRLGLYRYKDVHPASLSGGQKQRLAIACGVLSDRTILIFDEPTNGLDEAGIKEIRQLIEQEKERGALILLASHNQEDMKILADQVYKIADGRIERKGTEL